MRRPRDGHSEQPCPPRRLERNEWGSNASPKTRLTRSRQDPLRAAELLTRRPIRGVMECRERPRHHESAGTSTATKTPDP